MRKDCYLFELNLPLESPIQAQIQRNTQSPVYFAAEVAGDSACDAKTSAMSARATLRIQASSTLSWSSAFASMDHSHGFLARDTEWRWVMSISWQTCCVGYLGQYRKCAVVRQKIYPLSAAEFEYDKTDPRKDLADTHQRWHLVELVFCGGKGCVLEK